MESSSEPLGSPLKVLFLATADKYLSPEVPLFTQVKIDTPHGSFRLDTVLEHSGRKRVAVELDGAAFHDSERDAWRDAAVLKQLEVDAVVRIRGRDLYRYPFLVWWIVAKMYPWTVTARAGEVLKRQAEVAGLEDLSLQVGADGGYAMFGLPPLEVDEDDSEEAEPSGRSDMVTVWCRTREESRTSKRIGYLLEHPTLGVREVQSLYQAEVDSW